MENVMTTKQAVIDYINGTLQGYEGYVQFSHRPIDKDKDIFLDDKVVVEDEKGFIYEAHFANGKESISIKQINDSWLIGKTDISNIDDEDMVEFITDVQDIPNIKMAQIWEAEEDELCENLKVKKLKKVVFKGFANA